MRGLDLVNPAHADLFENVLVPVQLNTKIYIDYVTN